MVYPWSVLVCWNGDKCKYKCDVLCWRDLGVQNAARYVYVHNQVVVAKGRKFMWSVRIMTKNRLTWNLYHMKKKMIVAYIVATMKKGSLESCWSGRKYPPEKPQESELSCSGKTSLSDSCFHCIHLIICTHGYAISHHSSYAIPHSQKPCLFDNFYLSTARKTANR